MHARGIARGPVLFIALLLSAALALGLASPALATVTGGSTLPAAPTLCDSVRLLLQGFIPNSCYTIRGLRVGAPEPLPTMGPIPTYGIKARVRVEEPNPALDVVCPAVLEPYRLAEELGRLPFGRYWVDAREYVYPFGSADTTTPIDSSRAFIAFSVGADSCRASEGCVLLGFAPANSDDVRPDGCTMRALPGGRACFDVTMRNEAPVAAFQTVVEVPPGEAFPYDLLNLIVPTDVVPAERAAGFSVAWSREGTKLKIVVYSTTGAVIPPGGGPVLHLCYEIKAGIPEGSYEISFGPSLVSTPLGEVLPFCPTFQEVRGRLCVGEGGCDVNGDGVGDVRDIARLVGCVLRDSTDACPDSIRAKADCNDDSLVDVRDVVCCVRKVLTHGAGWGPTFVGAGPSTFSDGSSIGFEGPVESDNAFEAHATVSIVRGTSFGGFQFVLAPGTAARVSAISLEDPLGASTFGWEPRPDGSARVMVYDGGPVTASQASPGSVSGGVGTARLRVTLERSSSGSADGELSLDPVRGTTGSGTLLEMTYGALQVTLPASPIEAPAILPARPNPFVSETEISFSQPTAGPASLRLFDVTGRLVRTLHEGSANAGPQRLRWDGRDDRGRTVGVGIYFVRLTAGGLVRTERILRLR